MSTEPASVLIVDDDERLAKVIQFVLKRAGITADTAYSGQEGLDWLHKRQPAAIILDLMMPDISGFTFLREIRARTETQLVPVLVLTARADQASRLRSETLGANDFLVKPVNSETLVKHVREALHLPAAPPPPGP